jgi:hypothetical protein
MRKLILLALPLFILTSCKTTNEPETPQHTGPKVGSTFSYDYEMRDGENVLLDEGSIVSTLVKVNHSLAGKGNVLVYVDNEGDSSFFAKENNGNVSVYLDAEAADVLNFTSPFWINFPISGSGGENRVLAQQQVEYNGVPATLRATLRSNFEGNDAITMGGKNYTVKQGSAVIRMDLLVNGQVIDGYDLLQGNLYWMPELNAMYATTQRVELEDTRAYAQELTGANIK